MVFVEHVEKSLFLARFLITEWKQDLFSLSYDNYKDPVVRL